MKKSAQKTTGVMAKEDTRNVFQIFVSLSSDFFSVAALKKKMKSPITGDNVKEFILAKRDLCEENSLMYWFYAHLYHNWRVFLLLDFMRVNELYLEDTRLVNVDEANGVVIAVEDAMFKEKLGMQTKYRDMVIEKYDDLRGSKDQKTRQTETGATMEPIYARLFDQVNHDPASNEFRFDRIGVSPAQSVTFTAINIKIKEIKRSIAYHYAKAGDVREEPVLPLVDAKPPIPIYRAKAKAKAQEKKETPPTLAEVRARVVDYRHLTAYVEWLLRNPSCVVTGYAILPYMIRYTEEHIDMIRLLCLTRYTRDISLLEPDKTDKNDKKRLTDLIEPLPAIQYERLLSMADRDTYMKHFERDILVPQCHINVWEHIVAHTKAMFGLHTVSPTQVTVISPLMADTLYRIVEKINIHMEKELKYVDVGYDRDIIDAIFTRQFLVDKRAEFMVPVRYDTTEWIKSLDYGEIKRDAIVDTVRMIRAGEPSLFDTAINTASLNIRVMVPSTIPNSTLAQYEVLHVGIVRPPINIANRNRIGLYNDVALMIDLEPYCTNKEGLGVCVYESCHTLSLGDLYDVVVRRGAGAEMSLKAFATDVMRLFTRTDDDTHGVLYARISTLLEQWRAYRPIVTTTRDERSERGYRRVYHEGISVGAVKRHLDKEIADGVKLNRQDGNTLNVLTRTRDYRILMRDDAGRGCLDLTETNLYDALVIGDPNQPAVTVMVFRDKFVWHTVTEDTVATADANETSVVQFIIEHRKHREPQKLERLVVPYDRAVDATALEDFRVRARDIIRDTLDLPETRVSLYDATIPSSGILRVMLVVDDDSPPYPVDCDDTKDANVMRIIDAYTRRLSYVKSSQTGGIGDIFIPDAGDGAVIVDDMVIDNNNRGANDGMEVIQDDNNGVDGGNELYGWEDDRIVPDGTLVWRGDKQTDEVGRAERMDLAIANLREYKQWLYYNDAEKNELYEVYNHQDGHMIPCVRDDGYVLLCHLVSIDPGLYGGDLTLLEFGGTDIFVISVDDLVYRVERALLDKENVETWNLFVGALVL